MKLLGKPASEVFGAEAEHSSFPSLKLLPLRKLPTGVWHVRPHFFYYLFYGRKFSEIMSGFEKKIKK